jgi:hypothetical protein
MQKEKEREPVMRLTDREKELIKLTRQLKPEDVREILKLCRLWAALLKINADGLRVSGEASVRLVTKA